MRPFRFRDWPLRWKMMALLLAASSLPLIIVTVVASRSASAQLRQDATDLLRARAAQLAGELDEFHHNYVASAGRFAEFPEVKEFQDGSGSARVAEREAFQSILEHHRIADPNIRAMAVADRFGIITMATERGLIGKSIESGDAFRKAASGAGAISGPFISSPETGSVPSIAYYAPVTSRTRAFLGVVVLYVRAEAFWGVVRAGHGAAGEGSFAVVMDNLGIRIGDSSRTDTLFRPGNRLDEDTITELAGEGRFGERTRELLESPFPSVNLYERARSIAQEDVFRSRIPGSRRWNLAVAQRLKSAPWTVFYLVSEEALFSPVQRLIRETILASAAIIAVALGVGLLLSGRIIRPAALLASAAKTIARGDLTARVDLERGDELGELAANFNRMTAALAAGRLDLEDKVRERTEALEAAKTELESRNRKLSEWSAEIVRRQTQDLVYGRTLAALAGDGALEAIVPRALVEASALLGPEFLHCYRLTEERTLLRIREGGGAGSPEFLPAAAYGRAAGALSSRQTLVLEPVPRQVQEAFPLAIPGVRIKALVFVPLVVEDRDVGILAMGASQSVPEPGLDFLEDLAVPLALTIARHDLHRQTERFAQELAAGNEILRRQAEELSSQRDELRLQHRALEAKSREVERANQLKSEFLANMSHELRTPLNAIIGFSDLLLEEGPERRSPKETRWVEDILASGRHLLSLINDILDLAKIEAGRATLAREPLPPEDAIADAVALIEPEARKRGISVRIRVRAPGNVHADRGKLRQILLNLLSNSVKFSPAGCAVEVGADADGPGVRFWVRDEGPGIDESLRRELFQPFVQGESAMVKKHQGTGLGLVISKKLVEQHGGTISLENFPGGGLKVTFTISAEVPKPDIAVPVHLLAGGAVGSMEAGAAGSPVQGGGGGEARAKNAGEPGGSSRANRTAAGERRSTILVVDDHDLNRELSRTLLERLGYRVVKAEDGRSGIEAARRERPDLILMDLAMPGLDGFTATRELKAGAETSEIPVVALTALAMPGDRKRALEAGFDGYITKPVEAATLQTAIARLITRT